MDTGKENSAWAEKIIDGLIGQGVDYFCCAPGSRSTPLLLAIASHPKAKTIVHFDERGLCFHAVGYGKATKKPAAIVVSSGTAVANLLPGILEAAAERIPLILLTADRPPELLDCGANQTCDQNKLFEGSVRWQVELPCPDSRIKEEYLASTITHAVAMALSSPSGPVQINCHFREPLFASQEPIQPLQKHVSFELPELHPSEACIETWCARLSSQKKGIILAGSSSQEIAEEVFALADLLKWPIFADILSPLRTFDQGSNLITHFDPILKVIGDVNIEAVIQFGDRYTSKTLSLWLEKQTPEFYLHVSDHTMRQDPQHLATHRVHASPSLFCRELMVSLPEQRDSAWRSQWVQWDQECKQALATHFCDQDTLTEPGLIWEIASFFSDEWSLFLANSMPIRDANQFFLAEARCGAIFGNRGVSGIDGNIATAAGIAEGMQQPTLAVLGDLSFLHDVNSLALLSKLSQPLILCIVNNGGGGIFSFLPISKRKEAFEEFFAASHAITFSSAAALFNIPYFHPQSPAELGDLLFHQKKKPTSCIIEITTDRSENVRIHEQIIEVLKECLAQSSAATPAALH